MSHYQKQISRFKDKAFLIEYIMVSIPIILGMSLGFISGIVFAKTGEKFSTSFWIVVMLPQILIVIGVYWIFSKLFKTRESNLKKVKNYEKGWDGEYAVDKILKELPIGFKYIHDIPLSDGNKKYNLDFLIFSNTHIFALEVKNTKGIIDYDNTKKCLTLNGYPRTYRGQVRGCARQIKIDIDRRFGFRSIFIDTIVVFTGNDCHLKFASGTNLDGTVVLKKEDLAFYLKKMEFNKQRNNLDHIRKIFTYLKYRN
jgi:hypothetical protein